MRFPKRLPAPLLGGVLILWGCAPPGALRRLPSLAGREEVREGISLLSRGRPTEAAALLVSLARGGAEPVGEGDRIDRGRAAYFAGVALRRSGVPTQALAFFALAASTYTPLEDYAWNAVGETSFGLGLYPEAASAWRGVVARWPGSRWAERAVVGVGDAERSAGNPTGAIQAYQTLLGRNPDSPRADLAIAGEAFAYEAMGDRRRSDQACERVWNLYPASPSADLCGGRLKATGSFAPPPGEVVARAERLIDAGRPQQAARELQDLLAGLSNPWGGEGPHARLTLGIAWSRAGHPADAVAALEPFLRRAAPQEVREEALFWLGKALAQAGDRPRAKTVYLKLIFQHRKGDRAPNAWYKVGLLDLYDDKVEPARKSFARMLLDFPHSPLIPDALWQLAWIDLSQGNWSSAQVHLAQIERNKFTDPAARRRATYWTARALQETGAPDAALALYRKIATGEPPGYYRALAALRGGRLDPSFPGAPTPAAVSDPPGTGADLDRLPPPARFHWDRLEELDRIGWVCDLVPEALLLERYLTDDPGLVRSLIRFYEEAGDYYHAQLAARSHFGDVLESPAPDPGVLRLGYPRGYASVVEASAQSAGLDPLFVFALIDQESRFDPRAHSPAEADGLMQIIPATARTIAGRLSDPPPGPGDLWQPERNVRYGTWYFRQLLDQYRANPLLALAAYNGGPDNVKQWLSDFPGGETDAFVEGITFGETRDYVKHVVENYCRYAAAYGGGPCFDPAWLALPPR